MNEPGASSLPSKLFDKFYDFRESAKQRNIIHIKSFHYLCHKHSSMFHSYVLNNCFDQFFVVVDDENSYSFTMFSKLSLNPLEKCWAAVPKSIHGHLHTLLNQF